MRDEPHTGRNPKSDTAILHKITLFNLKIVIIVNHYYLMYIFPVCQDDEDISKIHQANGGFRKYQSNEQENHRRLLCFQACRSRHSRLFLRPRNFKLR